MTSPIGPLLEECCNPCPSCGEGCKNDCPVNIQSTNPKCLRVDTSECGVIKLEPACPKPTYVTAGDNVTIKEVTPPSDCFADGGDCDVKGGWEVSATDEKVKACSGDTTPGYLDEKLVEGKGITISHIGCDGSTNSKLKISVDDDAFPEPPNDKVAVRAGCEAKYLEDVLKLDTRLLKTSVRNCQLVLEDNYAFRKIFLQTDIVQNDIATGQTPNYIYTGSNSSWETVKTSGGVDYAKNVDFVNGVLKIKIPGLYYVGFSGTMEIGSGIHAMRAQLYRTDNSAGSGDISDSRYTIIESRYSAPVGWPPYEVGGSPSGFKLDTPYRQLKTDVEGVIPGADGYSASLGSYVSRMPVGGDTIEVFGEGDLIVFGAKASTQVDYHGDQMTETDKTGHFAFLCRNSQRSGGVDIGGEPGLTIFVSLITPL